MVKCLICGFEREISIVEHLRHTHKLTVPKYKELYQGAEVKSEKARQLISEQNQKVWRDEEYKKKMIASRQISHRTEKFRKEQSERIKSVYARGFVSWNAGLSKEIDERLVSIGIKNSNHLTGRTKETHEYLKKHSVELEGIIPAGFDKKEWSEEKIKLWKEKISKTISNGISVGNYSFSKNSYSKGWYEKPNKEKEYYESSWELEIMKYLDFLGLEWTKKHKIIISYKDASENARRYVPDFLIVSNEKKLLLEIKGYSRSQFEVDSKKKAAESWAIENSATYKLCWSIQEAKNTIEEYYEIFKDSKN